MSAPPAIARATAWLLRLPDGQALALAPGHIVHLLPEIPVLQPAANAPAYRAREFLWQGRPAPVIDPGGWYDPAAAVPGLLAVVGLSAPGDPQGARYGGVLMREVPMRIQVSDDQAVPAERIAQRWRRYAVSGFLHEGRSIPVVDPDRLFDDRLAPASPALTPDRSAGEA